MTFTPPVSFRSFVEPAPPTRRPLPPDLFLGPLVIFMMFAAQNVDLRQKEDLVARAMKVVLEKAKSLEIDLPEIQALQLMLRPPFPMIEIDLTANGDLLINGQPVSKAQVTGKHVIARLSREPTPDATPHTVARILDTARRKLSGWGAAKVTYQ